MQRTFGQSTYHIVEFKGKLSVVVLILRKKISTVIVLHALKYSAKKLKMDEI